MKLIDATTRELQLALDLRMRRHEVLTSNVANADTPGYRAKDLDFEAAMAQARQGARAGVALEAARPGASAALPGEGRTHIEIVPPAPPPVGAAPPRLGDPLVPMAGSSPGLDGNSVDLDRNMVAMSENALLYGAAAKAVGKKLAILRYVASDGVA